MIRDPVPPIEIAGANADGLEIGSLGMSIKHFCSSAVIDAISVVEGEQGTARPEHAVGLPQMPFGQGGAGQGELGECVTAQNQ